MSARDVIEQRRRMIPNPENSELAMMQMRVEDLGQQINSMQTQFRNVTKSISEFVAEVNKVIQAKDAKIRELQVPIKKDKVSEKKEEPKTAVATVKKK